MKNFLSILLILTIVFCVPANAKRPKKTRIFKKKTELVIVPAEAPRDTVAADTVDINVIEELTEEIITEKEVEVLTAEGLEQRFMDQLGIWYVTDSLESDTTGMEIGNLEIESFVPQFEDSVFINRIASISSPIPLTYNNVVRSVINTYTVKNREKFEKILGLSEYYFPQIEEIFDKYELPLELRYVAVIESAMNPSAVSRAGATGMWQFMLSTGRLYKLEISTYVDERRDFVKATDAAARYLSDLYKIYGNWPLAIAAYNCGPGNINRAIRRSGGKYDFWDIYNFLPRETRGYVPGFIAAVYSSTFYKEHNLTPLKVVDIPVADTVMVNKDLNLLQVSEVMNIPIDVLRSLNPQYRRDIVPGNSKPYPLRLPSQLTPQFVSLSDTIYQHKKDEYLSSSYRSRVPAGGGGVPVTSVAGRDKVVHTIRSGETLGSIAAKYGVRVSDLQNWNGMAGTRIRAGAKLSVFVKSSGSSASGSKASSAPVAPLREGEYLIHTVRSGDTIWAISREYGVTQDQLLQWNGLTKSSKLKIGQKLKIKAN